MLLGLHMCIYEGMAIIIIMLINLVHTLSRHPRASIKAIKHTGTTERQCMKEFNIVNSIYKVYIYMHVHARRKVTITSCALWKSRKISVGIAIVCVSCRCAWSERTSSLLNNHHTFLGLALSVQTHLIHTASLFLSCTFTHTHVNKARGEVLNRPWFG